LDRHYQWVTDYGVFSPDAFPSPDVCRLGWTAGVVFGFFGNAFRLGWIPFFLLAWLG